jgi:ectoine hydroxylase-related dioxygenase (phytanoyl-CoA dioxygenase family)
MSDAIRRGIGEDGYVVLPDILSADFVRRARAELERAIDADSRRYGPQAERDYGMVLLCALHGGAFLELLDNHRLLEPFNAVLGDDCIIYAYTSSSMPPRGRNYSARIHTDCPRLIPGYVTNMGVTLPLDDFDERNGATWYLPRSHQLAVEPTRDQFYASAVSSEGAPAPAFFNARLWHAGGENLTEQWRHALTINVCRPYMTRIDIPRAMAAWICPASASRRCRNSGSVRSRASLEEHLPPDRRSFRQVTR